MYYRAEVSSKTSLVMFNDLPELLLQGEDLCDLQAHRLLQLLGEVHGGCIPTLCEGLLLDWTTQAFLLFVNLVNHRLLHGTPVLVLGQLGIEGSDQLSSITTLVNLRHLDLYGALVLVLGQLGGLES